MGERIKTYMKLFLVFCFVLFQTFISAQTHYEQKAIYNNNDLDLLTDIDGNQYKVVRIGDQVWMAENLRTSRFRNGDKLDYIKSNDKWSKSKKAAWSWYENDPLNDSLYGKLYNSYSVNDKRCLCPTGWHVPSKNEWNILKEFLQFTYGTKNYQNLLKSNYGWHQELNGIDYIGFNGLPGGFRSYRYYDERLYNPLDPPSNTTFYHAHFFGVWWLSSNDYFFLSYKDLIYPKQLDSRYSSFGFSVRCVKD
jgi:uncharacterized protein (TIGR02145 family)